MSINPGLFVLGEQRDDSLTGKGQVGVAPRAVKSVNPVESVARRALPDLRAPSV